MNDEYAWYALGDRRWTMFDHILLKLIIIIMMIFWDVEHEKRTQIHTHDYQIFLIFFNFFFI